MLRVLQKLKMDGVHGYLLAAQIDLINLNLVDWWSIYSNSAEYKNLKRGFGLFLWIRLKYWLE